MFTKNTKVVELQKLRQKINDRVKEAHQHYRYVQQHQNPEEIVLEAKKEWQDLKKCAEEINNQINLLD